MTEQEMQEKIDDLKEENEKLKKKNKKLKEHNDQLIHCIDVYKRFISGGSDNA